ncbi:antibiotic biosynthesis monooxygenase family protein [Nocardia sp. GCM10030253]|uniref:antibiotic biosynthesis monooxygenase family protein n=1 Tax=Nocardia sp. GCM10030253 TaxID=3273404 RepID=UPI00362989EA
MDAPETYASGNWVVAAGRENEFVASWTEFLDWTKNNAPGFVSASLIHDVADPRHFVSFALWSSPAARSAWQQHEGFASRVGACRAMCDEASGSSYHLAARVEQS